MFTEIVILFLGISLAFYILFGGADFGAGVLELITRREEREIIAHAIGPVWEANHVWLILAVVILFMGFPGIYATLSLYLHIPILILLIGIVLRGTAFAYMHYDAIRDKTGSVYNWTFQVSSLIAPFFLGVVVGAAILGRINPSSGSFGEAFIAPWFNGFAFSVGLFTVCLCTLLAAVYIIAETDDPDRRGTFVSAAKKVNAATVVAGGLVFLSAEWYGLPLAGRFIDSGVAIGAVVLATLSLPVLWRNLNRQKALASRVTAGIQAVLILFAWFWVQHPTVIEMQGAADLTFSNTAAPESTMLQLTLALLVGSAIILPFLWYLMKTFKGSQF